MTVFWLKILIAVNSCGKSGKDTPYGVWVPLAMWWFWLQTAIFHLLYFYFAGFPRILECLGIFTWISRTCKVLENVFGPGNLLASSRKILEFGRQWCRWQFLAPNRHVSADKNSHNCCHQVRFLGCRCDKNADPYSAPQISLDLDSSLCERHKVHYQLHNNERSYKTSESEVDRYWDRCGLVT